MKIKTRPNILYLSFLVAALIVTGLFHINSRSAPSFGTMPEFSLAELNQEDIKGQRVFINFFASWCTPCEAEHPALEKISEHIPVYGIAFMDKPEKTNKFLERLGDPFTKHGNDMNGTAADQWGIMGVPASFIVDEQGEIIYKLNGVITDKIFQKDIMPLIAP